MKVITTSSNDRIVTIEATLEELAELHAALIRKKRTKRDIAILHMYAGWLAGSEPALRTATPA